MELSTLALSFFLCFKSLMGVEPSFAWISSMTSISTTIQYSGWMENGALNKALLGKTKYKK